MKRSITLLFKSIASLALIFSLAACGGGSSNTNPPVDPPVDPPVAPNGVTLYPGDGQISVRWNTVTNADTYNIYISTSAGVTKSNYSSLPSGIKHSNVTSPYVIPNLINGNTYYVVVTAGNISGESSESAEESTTPLSVPGAPSGVTGSAAAGQVTLTWDNVATADSYNIYLASEPSVTKSNYTSLENGIKIPDVTSPYVVSGLRNQERYFLVVTSVNTTAESSESYELIAVPGSRGWSWLNPTPTGNDLLDVEFVDTLTGWAVGRGGTILRTDNGGTSWTKQWDGASLHFLAISAIDASNAWIVGIYNNFVGENQGILLSTNDGGGSWLLHATPSESFLSGLDFVSAGRGWVVGDSGIYHTNDAGKTWSLQSVESARAVKFIDADNGWVIAGKGSGGTVYKTTDGGLNWVSQSLGSALTGIDFVDSTHGWVSDYAASGSIYATSNGGNSWGSQPTTASYLHDIAFGDTNAGWIVGINGQISHTTNGGGSWPNQISGTLSHLYAIDAVDASNAWAVGYGGIILHTSNGGSTWVHQSANQISSSSGLFDIEFVDSANGWAVGRAIVNSTDGGTNWSVQLSGLSEPLHDVDFVSSSLGWAVGDGSQIYKTTNGGTNWSVQNSSGATQLWGVSFADASSGWAVGPVGVIRATTNGGSSWAAQASGTSSHLFKVHFVDAYNGWIVGSSGIILHTTNGGVAWLGQISGTTADIRGLHALDVNTVWAVDTAGNVLATTDGGSNWNVVATLDMGAETIYFADHQHGWITSGNGDMFASTDGGITWVKQSSGVNYPHGLRGLSFIDANTGWVAGGGGVGVILKTTTGGNTP